MHPNLVLDVLPKTILHFYNHSKWFGVHSQKISYNQNHDPTKTIILAFYFILLILAFIVLDLFTNLYLLFLVSLNIES